MGIRCRKGVVLEKGTTGKIGCRVGWCVKGVGSWMGDVLVECATGRGYQREWSVKGGGMLEWATNVVGIGRCRTLEGWFH